MGRTLWATWLWMTRVSGIGQLLNLFLCFPGAARGQGGDASALDWERMGVALLCVGPSWPSVAASWMPRHFKPSRLNIVFSDRLKALMASMPGSERTVNVNCRRSGCFLLEE